MTEFNRINAEKVEQSRDSAQQTASSHLFESAYDFATKLDKHFNDLDMDRNGGITKRELQLKMRNPLSDEQYNVANTLYSHFDQLTATFTLNGEPQRETTRKTVSKLQRLSNTEFCWDQPSQSNVGKGMATGALAGGVLSKAAGGSFRSGAGTGAALGGLFAATKYAANEWAGNKITSMQNSIDAWPEFARGSCQPRVTPIEPIKELPKEHTPPVVKKYYWVGPMKNEAGR